MGDDAAAAAARHAPYLLQALALALEARLRGDHPFGAVLLDPETGTVLCTGLNSVITTKDCTGHAETNLIREASRTLPPDVLRRSVLYSSAVRHFVLRPTPPIKLRCLVLLPLH